MPAASLVPADLAADGEALQSIHVEYLGWVRDEMEQMFGPGSHGMGDMSVPEYAAHMAPQVCGIRPPVGAFYLVKVDGQVAGMGGLRFMRRGVAEIKRLYVRPGCRGMGLGPLILRRLMSDAVSFGYRSVCLDTAPFMQAAHRLYEAFGFVDCEAYEGTEVPSQWHGRWRFMRCSLPGPPADLNGLGPVS